ncbi:hypothetical protein ACWKSP_39910 [Micromonosporaceae bacterium Da 78-11]
MPDFDDDLRSLAGHGQRTGRLDPAATIRRRADRRRRQRHAATGALGVVLLGALTFGIAAIRPDALPPNPPAASTSVSVAPVPTTTTTTTTPPSAAPSSSASSAPPSSPSSAPPSSAPSTTPSKTTTSSNTSGGIFSGTRQVYLLPKNNEATVAVDSSMNAGLSDAFDDRALFVFTPNGGRYSIKTAKLRVNNDPANETFCLAVKNGTVIATACDSGDSNQLFYVTRSGTTTSTDKATYSIRTKDYVFLRVATPSSNLTASKIDEGTADAGTDFVLPDQGKAALPALD